MRLLKVIGLLLITTFATSALSETRLMMVEEDGCPWCERWNADVGDVYDRTEEGIAAPLWRHDISDELPEGVSLSSRPQFTPTFILLVDGTEVNRIEGYPGEGFFWGLLGIMLANLPKPGGNLRAQN